MLHPVIYNDEDFFISVVISIAIENNLFVMSVLESYLFTGFSFICSNGFSDSFTENVFNYKRQIVAIERRRIRWRYSLIDFYCNV